MDLLSTAAILEKNKLANTGVWIYLLKITMPDTTVIRICLNTENIDWPSDSGTSTSVGANYLTDTSKSWDTDAWAGYTLTDSGSNTFTITSNTSNTLTISGTPDAGAYTITKNTYTAFPFEMDEIGDSSKGELQEWAARVGNASRVMEAYMEAADGGVDADVVLRAIHSKHLDIHDPEIELNWKAVNSKADNLWATFVLGATAPWNKRFPRNRIFKHICRYKVHKGSRCGYSGGIASCDRTLLMCRVDMSNSERFGGAPGVGYKGLWEWPR